MEVISGGSEFVRNLAHQGVQINLNSALYGLVTPPRYGNSLNRSMSVPSETRPKFKTPPAKTSDNQEKSAPRNSPSRLSPSQLDANGFYAGAKFGERPSPTQLPKPPVHWVEKKTWGSREQSCVEMTNNLKVLLKVQS